ncbi:MAG: IclR family transcriptional regulator [Alphaproteobacteria bacterium]|nr:IclR family transcriptional regulator [Alphaproteobacteria bacterium]MDA8000684.1 IclR family transcriptional regulator [Alphaproteobacteria bacterium]MDA8003951.1 IclR family transcriptional regulator [Alphaproteobacteria bacterium]MDA8004990.1 IclR family transcriptional regulator [Alphaproteobacteria bacterium]
MNRDTSNDKYRAPALEKGLDILELLSQHAGGMSQGEVAGALARSQSEIYRMLSTLVRRGYVVRSPSGDRYALSLKMFSLGQRHPPIERVVETALPKMRAIARKAWQSCHLGMENNGDIVIIAAAESPGNWSLALRSGSVVGLWNTGTGRVLAAFRSREEVDALVGLHRRAVGEPELNRAEFDAHLARIRALGYEQMPSATATGVTNIAFPIFDSLGRVTAALSCPYLERVDELEVPSQDEIIRMYGLLARELTALHGGTVPHFGDARQ